MAQQTLTLLNTSILTALRTYRWEPVSLERVREIVCEFQQNGKRVQSAIGHQSTADLLSTLLDWSVPVNRMEYKQTKDDAALVLKLKERRRKDADA